MSGPVNLIRIQHGPAHLCLGVIHTRRWSKRHRKPLDLSGLDALPDAPVNVRVMYDGVTLPTVDLAYRGMGTPPGSGKVVHVWEAVAVYEVGRSVDPSQVRISADMIPAHTAIMVKFLVDKRTPGAG